jgi:hypothetical protein
MPFLNKPEIYMPEMTTTQDKKTLHYIYLRIIENKGKPSSEFIVENPDYTFNKT